MLLCHWRWCHRGVNAVWQKTGSCSWSYWMQPPQQNWTVRPDPNFGWEQFSTCQISIFVYIQNPCREIVVRWSYIGKQQSRAQKCHLKLKWRKQINHKSKAVQPSPSERPPEVWSVDVGGTTLPGLTLETAKEHTRVSCGWPDARDACKARPTIEAQGLASPYHHSPAWPHRPIKTRPSPLLFFFPFPLLCVSLISSPLFICHFSLVLPLPIFTKHLTHSSFPSLPLLIASDWKKKDGKRGMRLRERDREGENQRKRGSYHEPLWPGQTVLAPWDRQNSFD